VPPPLNLWLFRVIAVDLVASTVSCRPVIDQQVPAGSFGLVPAGRVSPVHGESRRDRPWLASLSASPIIAQSARVQRPVCAQKSEWRQRMVLARQVIGAPDASGCVSPGHGPQGTVLDAMGLIVADSPRGQHRPIERQAGSGGSPLWSCWRRPWFAASRQPSSDCCVERIRCDLRDSGQPRTPPGESRCRGDQSCAHSLATAVDPGRIVSRQP